MARKVHVIVATNGDTVDDVRIHETRTAAKASYTDFLRLYAGDHYDVRWLRVELRR